MIRLRPATVGDIPILKKWDEGVDVWTSGGESDGFIQIIDAANESKSSCDNLVLARMPRAVCGFQPTNRVIADARKA